MCDGESMFVESCPGGTVWDDLNKACVWPDMQGVVGASLADQSQSQQSSYGSIQRSMNTQYGPQIHHQRPVQHEQPKLISSYSQSPVRSSYGSQMTVQQPQIKQFQLPQQQDQQTSSYGSQQQIQLPQQQMQLPQQQIQLPQQQDQQTSSYGSQQQMQLPQQQMQLPQQQDQTEQIQQQFQLPQQSQTSSYGSQQSIQRPQIWQQPIQRQQDIRPVQQQQVSGY